ncbi:hypothetical protein [Algivirga pacifica]|uniref:Uncharacterized protein n=1 Tax=Algivirga pacifica TaxID=1162670 RepID=A0ABP9D1F0_9BACT
MKKLFYLPFFMLIGLLASCDHDHVDAEENFAEMESDWVRLTLIHHGEIELMQANTGAITYSLEQELPEGAYLYTSGSGRYISILDRAGNSLKFFDSGVEKHDDHGHEYAPRLLDVNVEAPLPTHYAGYGSHSVVFNDGDGSFTHINEMQLEIPSYSPAVVMPEGTEAHHGAGFRLNNGVFAITYKTNSEDVLPQVVHFLNADGTVLKDGSEVEVGRIHGDAVNGEFGVFGSTDGVILVDNQNNISLIPNTEQLNSESGNWIGTLKGHDNADVFFGRARNQGVFMIDPIAKTLTPIYEGADVVGDMFSFNGEYYIVHTSDNMLRVFDAHDGEEVASRKVEMANIPAASNERSANSEIAQLRLSEEEDPILVASDEFLYILAPNRTQIKVLEIHELEHVHTITLDHPIEKIMKNGFSLEGEHDHDHDHDH